MNIRRPNFSFAPFALSALGSLLLIAGMLLPAAFKTAGAQVPDAAPATQNTQPPAEPTSTEEAQVPQAAIVVQRDPFLPDDSQTSAQTQIGAPFMQQMQTADLPPGMHLVAMPDALTAGKREPEARRDEIAGIVVGARPYALVNTDGKTRLLTVGDTFEGRKIASITLHGVAFDDHSIAHIPLLDQ